MGKRLEIDEVVSAVRTAFAPLDCGVEVFDYDQKLRFRVFDAEGKALLRVSEVLMRRAREPNGLSYIIESARDRLEHRGYKLKLWRSPKRRGLTRRSTRTPAGAASRPPRSPVSLLR
jgi:hypothetical protein